MAETGEGLWMSAKERDRLKVLHEVKQRHITQKQAANSRCPPSLVRSLRAVAQSTDLASYERFFTPSGRASIAMNEARRTQTPSPLPRAPIPALKSGTFYFVGLGPPARESS